MRCWRDWGWGEVSASSRPETPSEGPDNPVPTSPCRSLASLLPSSRSLGSPPPQPPACGGLKPTRPWRRMGIEVRGGVGGQAAAVNSSGGKEAAGCPRQAAWPLSPLPAPTLSGASLFSSSPNCFVSALPARAGRRAVRARKDGRAAVRARARARGGRAT